MTERVKLWLIRKSIFKLPTHTCNESPELVGISGDGREEF
jgi:hypothetical protein